MTRTSLGSESGRPRLLITAAGWLLPVLLLGSLWASHKGEEGLAAGAIAGIVVISGVLALAHNGRAESGTEGIGSSQVLGGLALETLAFSGLLAIFGLALLLDHASSGAVALAWLAGAGIGALGLYYRRAEVSQRRVGDLLNPGEQPVATMLAWVTRDSRWPAGPKALVLAVTNRRLVAAPQSLSDQGLCWTLDLEDLTIRSAARRETSRLSSAVEKLVRSGPEFNLEASGQRGRLRVYPGDDSRLFEAIAKAR